MPLEAINVASAREKSIRHGHPSTLHLWWARRPLAACRAVIFGQLVDDRGGQAASSAIKLAGPDNPTELEMVEAGVLDAGGGKVRLVERHEMPADWRPAGAAWSLAQALNHALNDGGGVTAAAALLAHAPTL